MYSQGVTPDLIAKEEDIEVDGVRVGTHISVRRGPVILHHNTAIPKVPGIGQIPNQRAAKLCVDRGLEEERHQSRELVTRYLDRWQYAYTLHIICIE